MIDSPKFYPSNILHYKVYGMHAHSPHLDKECSHVDMFEVQSCGRDYQCQNFALSVEVQYAERESQNHEDPYSYCIAG